MGGLRLIFEGFSELARRYRDVFLAAWRRRDPLDGKRYTIEEAQFLPAALSLQEAPVSPAPRAAMWLIVAFALIAVLWAVFGKMDIVAVAQGKIVTVDGTKTIQPIGTATVRAIHVAEGQAVHAGEVLVELDATTETADRERLTGELDLALLQAARARALLEGVDQGGQPRLDVPEERREGGADLLDQARVLLEGQYREYATKLARLDAEAATREAELRVTREVVARLERTAPIAARRARDLKKLSDRGDAGVHDWLEREQAAIEQAGDLAAQRGQVQRLEAALTEAAKQRAAFVAESRRVALESLREATGQITTLRQELVKAEQRGSLTRLTAPVDGTVQQLGIHTVGGVVTPAQPLMLVVPRDHPLEVEAFLENKDIGFVVAGQEAEAKLETFPYTKYGTIHGRVAHVSHDAIADEKRGLVYSARVALVEPDIEVDGRVVNLAPGMAVTVEIKTGRRRVIEYFLTPLMQYARESLRER